MRCVDFDMGSAHKSLIEQVKRENAEILAKSKKASQLVVPLEGRIEEIVFSTSNIDYTPHSERIFGGRTPTYSMGNFFDAKIYLVHPKVKIVGISGWPNLEVGDKIRAYLFKGKEMLLKDISGVVYYPNGKKEGLNTFREGRKISVWHECELSEGMSAVKIEKLGLNNKMLAVYKDADLCKQYGFE